MNKSQELRDYVRSNPGATNKAIADAVGLQPNDVAARTAYEVKCGRMTRVEVGRTLSNVVIYGHTSITAKPERQLRDYTRKVDKENVVKTKTTFSQSLDAMIEAFAEAAVTKFKASFTAKAQAAVQELLPQAPLPAEVKAPLIEDKRKKVLVVGLLPVQNAEIAKRFSNSFDLRFTDDVRQAGIQAMKVDKVFAHVKHMSHSMDKALQVAGGNLVRVNGGLTQICRELENYYGRT